VSVRMCSVVVAMMALAVLGLAGQSVTLQDDLLTDWTSMKNTMMKIADAMPEDKLGYKPTAAQRSYREQILHVSVDNVALMKLLGSKTPAAAIDKNAASKAETLKALADSFDYGSAVIREQTDRSIIETVEVPNFRGTRARLVWSAIGHAWDEYGVMTVYLRLNGIVPPASRGK